MVSVETFLLQILVLCLFLLLGYILRLKIRIFQKLFIPAPVIGGIIGLVLGPAALGERAIIPIPQDWIDVYAHIPGVLITAVMAGSVLGMRLPGRKEFVESVGKQLCYTAAFYSSQFAIGGIVGAIFVAGVYKTFGLELFAGFSGGHGTAGVYGQILQGLNADWWLLGQGVALTSATIGIVFGVIGGMLLINIAARKRQTALLESPKEIPEELRKGIFKDQARRKILGKSVTASDVLDPISYTFCLIAIPTLLGILMRKAFVAYSIAGLKDVGAYAWALTVSAILWIIVEKIGFGWILDRDIKNRIVGAMVDFLVVAAIISLPLKAVSQYILPIAVLMVCGMAGAVGMFFLGRWLLPDYWVERSIMTFGQSTGVTATGLLLLRIVDPDFKSPAVTAWGFSYLLAFPLFSIYMGVAAAMIMSRGYWSFVLLSVIITILAISAVRMFPGPVKDKI
ncbi:MAG: sodium/glutamate symporter [Planctomycetota bacterium]|jgi:ESS family glutamate:Na+ symporter